jgi:hypothetical protein
MNFNWHQLHRPHLPPSEVVERGHILPPLARDSMGRVIVGAGLVVLALIPLNLLQYRLLGWSVLVPLKEWLLHYGFANYDSWAPMRDALAYVHSVGPRSLYQIFFDEHVKFQYPPTALLPISGLQLLGIDPTNTLLNNMNRALIVINAIGVGWVFRLVLIRTRGRKAAASPVTISGAVMVGAATLLFYPVMMGFWLGQIQVWIDTGFTFACISILCNRKLTAGALVGLICLLKPQFYIFALWAILRRERRFMLGAAIVILPCVIISLAEFGLGAQLEYLHVLNFLSERGEAMIANNSVNGILNALLRTANPLIWEEHGFPPYNLVVHLGSLAAAVILITLALWRCPGRGTLNGLADFQFSALAFTMAAPIAWEHHYGIMAPMLATVFCLLVAAPESTQRRQQLLALVAVYLLSTICVTSDRYTHATMLNLAFGYLFFAGLGVLGMLWWVTQAPQPRRRHSKRAEQQAGHFTWR